jgi:hypothetical protein
VVEVGGRRRVRHLHHLPRKVHIHGPKAPVRASKPSGTKTCVVSACVQLYYCTGGVVRVVGLYTSL